MKLLGVMLMQVCFAFFVRATSNLCSNLLAMLLVLASVVTDAKNQPTRIDYDVGIHS